MKKQNDLVEILKKVYPSLVCEKDGEYEVDIEKLKLELGNGSDIIHEGYSLNWLGQSYSRVLRDCPTTTLIKPDNNHNQLPENINSDNVYIQGDNLEVLKHLKNTYSSKIKLIYIDPPYNTGSDGFVYNDSFNFDVETFMRLSGLDKEEAEKVLKYTKSKRNSHSAWLTFMYPRLYIARELLKDDGVIFISIDDNEQAQLKWLCDQIFGEENFIDCFIYEKTHHFGRQVTNTYKIKEYVLCYAKELSREQNIRDLLEERVQTEFEDAPLYNASNNDKTLIFPPQSVHFKIKDGTYRKTKDAKYELLEVVEVKNNYNENNLVLKFKSRWSQDTIDDEYDKGSRFLVKSENFAIRAIYADDKETSVKPRNIIFTNKNQNTNFTNLNGKCIGTTETASTYLEKLFNKKRIFSYPKNVELIEYLISLLNCNGEYILDFFSGSSTTADAVMNLNAEDNGNRKFIMVQLPEEIDEKNSKEAYEFCTKELKQKPIIPTIAKERIKRAAKKIKEENKDKSYIDDIDLGFKVYKTIKDDRTDVSQLVLFDVKDGIKTEVDDLEALLTTWMLHDGYDLNTNVEEFMINKYKGYLVEQTLYLLDKGFSTEELLLLVEKLNDPKTPLITQIILNSSNFGNKVLQEFHENVFSKNSKEAKNVVEDR